MLHSAPWRPRLSCLLLGLGVWAGWAAPAGAGVWPGTDLATHRFVPPVAPEAAAPQALRSARSQATPGLSGFAARQIAYLQAEKAARTPAQAKIDSRHLYTARMLTNRPAAPGVPYLQTGVELDAGGNLMMQLSADVSGDLLARLAARGVRVVEARARYHSILALVPPAQLEAIAEWPEIHALGPRAAAVTAGPEPAAQALGAAFQGSEGDVTHRAALARGGFAVDGTGLKIGVLSDGVTSLAASQNLGALGPVTTLTVGGVLQTHSGDEGTAMLEIVHALAPGASLYFATAFNSMQSFADNIRALRAAGCDILVDDVSYLTETRFQDGQAAGVVSATNGGIIAQAVNEVAAGGALYFSVAANDGNLDAGTGGVYEGDFVDGGPVAAPLTGSGRVHQFAPGVTYDTLTGGGIGVNLTWADPLGASANDYDLYLLDPTGTTVLAASTNLQNGAPGCDPEEYVDQDTHGNHTDVAGNRVVVVQAGGQPRFFNLSSNRGRFTYATGGAVYGHNAASGAFTVAATPAAAAYASGYPQGPYPGAFSAADAVEPFSSDGPRRLFFQADGTPITPGNFTQTGGRVLPKPDFTAADGVTVSGVGGFGSPFYGTSAAAPHAAAIAALAKAAAPAATPAELAAALAGGAIDILGTGWDRDSGAGILMADTTLERLGLASYADPVLVSAVASEFPGNGDGTLEAGEGASLVIQLRNLSVAPAATGITATLTSPTPGVVIPRPAAQAWPDLAPGAAASGPAPFRFTLGTGFDPASTSADFVLTLDYAGGTTPSKALPFQVPVGLPVGLTHALGAAPGTLPGIACTTGLQTDRIFRTYVPSACGTGKAWPGTAGDSAQRIFDAYTFTACRSGCGLVQLTSQGAGLFLAVYSPAFVPADIAANYLGDCGISAASQSLQADFSAGQTYTVVVAQVDPGVGAGSFYTLALPAGVIRCAVPNRAPVAVARDLVLAAGQDGTASGSVDGGSYDPDGDPLVLAQDPAGPYAIGRTPVLLTVTDPLGAQAQAAATVTVTPPALATTTVLTSPTGRYGATRLTALVSAAGANPAGTVTFSEAGVPLAPAATVDSSGQAAVADPGLDAGNHLVVATFSGTTGFQASASPATLLAVAQAPTAIVLASSGPSRHGDLASFTATVASAGGVPAGTVQFRDGGTLLGSAELGGTSAVLATAALSPGSHAITATFLGSLDYQGSVSATLTQVVTLSLQVVPDVTRLAVTAGQSATFHLELSAAGTLAGPVSYQLTGLPPGAVATFTPDSGTVSSLPAEITVTLSTPPEATLLAGGPRPGGGHWGWLAVGAGLVAVPVAGRRGRRGVACLIAVLVVVIAGLTACGGGGGGSAAGTSGTSGTNGTNGTGHYTLQITVDSQGAVQGQASLPLDLQP